eukprot:scaffold252403_cov19-Prasinocladus_malaysianus.AAC.1
MECTGMECIKENEMERHIVLAKRDDVSMKFIEWYEIGKIETNNDRKRGNGRECDVDVKRLRVEIMEWNESEQPETKLGNRRQKR